MSLDRSDIKLHMFKFLLDCHVFQLQKQQGKNRFCKLLKGRFGVYVQFDSKPRLTVSLHETTPCRSLLKLHLVKGLKYLAAYKRDL